MSDRDDHGGSVLRGAAVNLIGDVLGLMEPLFYIAVSRLLGSGRLGEYLVATTFVAALLRLGVAGLDKGLLRHVPIARATGEPQALASTLGTALRWGVGLALAIVAASVLFPGTFVRWGAGEAPTAATWIQALVLTLPLQCFTALSVFAVRGLSRMRPYVIVQNVIAPGSLIVLSTASWLAGSGARALVHGYVGSALVTAVAAFATLVRNFPEPGARALARSGRDRALLAFSFPQGLTELLNYLLGRFDILIIAAFYPDRPELVAVYGVASLQAGAVKRVRIAFDNSLSPTIADLFERGDRPALAAVYETTATRILVLFLFLGGLLSIAAPALLSLYDPGFVRYWLLVPILVGARLLNGLAGPAQATLLMSGRSRLELANNVVANAVNLGLLFWFVPRWGLWGAATAAATSLTLFNLVRILEVGLLTGIWVRTRRIVSLVLPAVPVIVLLAGAPRWLGAPVLVHLAVAALWPPLFAWLLLRLGHGPDLRAAWDQLRGRRQNAA